MQYNDVSGGQGIIQDITFWTGVDLSAFQIADRTRSVNEWYRTVWTWIFDSYGGWQFIDSNVSDTSTGVPYADQTITSGTGLYALPSAALTVTGVEIQLSSGGPFTRLIPITQEQFQLMGGDGRFPSTGTPLYYMLQGDIIRLLSVPNYTLAGALRVYFDQDISLFAVGDTTKVPGFASVFHRILSFGPSYDWCAIKGPKDRVPQLLGLLQDNERRLKSFYGQRYKTRFPNRVGPGADLVDEFS